jgi:sulfoxide reductase heme-binding subunit YedZ
MSAKAIDTALWDLGRATGVVTLALLTIVVALGIVTRSGRPLPGLPRFAVSAVHRSASLLAVVFLVIHIVTLTLDPQSQLRWIDAVIPFGSHFRPLWIGLGALSLDLMVALVVTSLLRERIGRRVWRAIHWAAYALWPFAVLHTIGAGTDAGRTWMVCFLVACAAAFAVLLGWRFSTGFLDPAGRVAGTQVPGSRGPQTRSLAGTRGPR